MKRQSGFSLVELLVAVAITSLLVLLLANVGESAGSAWQKGAAQAETYSTARGSIGILGRELEGTVIDLDIGFQLDEVPGEPGNRVLKFLRRRDPDDAGSVEKTAYQLAWASAGLVPKVQAVYDAAHPVPVLIRTTSTNLSDVYEITPSGGVNGWVKNWGTLSPGEELATGVRGGADGETMVEIAAEYVLAWEVIPKFWNGSQVASDDVANPAYYGGYLTSDRAPRALEIRLAVVPSRLLNQVEPFPAQWGGVRSRANPRDIFDYSLLSETNPFDRLLRKNLRRFGSTFFLSSRTP
jgi:prepilin-type N-terminal cleavage/methylation domain-containing protein